MQSSALRQQTLNIRAVSSFDTDYEKIWFKTLAFSESMCIMLVKLGYIKNYRYKIWFKTLDSNKKHIVRKSDGISPLIN